MPLLVVSNAAQEADIAEALLAGAQDLVSLGQTERLRSVAERELRAFRLERALNETLFSANQYKKQLKAFLAGSVDAIAHTQEGILVDANQAWADLLGHENGDALLGVPLMDLFDNASKAALKGALVACGRGQWTGGSLKVTATTSGGDKLPIELNLEATSVDGDPAVKLSVPRPPAAAREPEELIEQAVHKDPMTGFYHRRRFLEVLTDRLDAGGGRGVRVLAYIRPDKFRELEEQIGPLASEDVLVQIAEQLRELTQPHDLYGRFGGQIFTMFLERGTLRDVEAWAQNALARIAARIFESDHNTLSVTCTIGLAEIGPSTERLDALLAEARRSNQLGRDQGGNQVVLQQTSDESTRVQRFDEIWVQQIKAALMENRFRLAHLPIASLSGEHQVMFDTVLRMIDAQGDEVTAAEFMPAAMRNRLMRAIDRWVIGASLAFCTKTPLDCVFIKLSYESLIDRTLLDWLAQGRPELRRRAADPLLPSQRGERDPVSDADQGARGAAPRHGAPLRARELRRRPRLGKDPRPNADGLPQDRRLADAEHRDRPCAAGESPRLRARRGEPHDPRDRGARRGRQHDGRAVPARRGLHARPLRPRARGRALGRARRRYSALSRSTVLQPRGNAMPRRPRSPA